MKQHFFGLLLIFSLSGCGVALESEKFDDGYYWQYIKEAPQDIYVDIAEDTVSIYSSEGKEKVIDTAALLQQYPQETRSPRENIPALWEKSFDLDFHSILLKYRPSQQGVPPQLNSDLNATAYLGYRADRYKLKYETDPLGNSELRSTQIGFSLGLFTGIGNTFMSPTTTAENIESEYDGVVWLNGVTALVGFNGLTAGISLGFDSLLDENSKFWIYQGKPWIGLAVGFNIN
jgi:hypothetical protein